MKTLKTIKTYLLVSAVTAVIVFAGCAIPGVPTEEVNVAYDLMEMRAMIPVIEAGLMVVVPDDSMGSSRFGIKTYTDPGGLEPFEIYGTPDPGSTVRHPSGDAYIEDFYGTAGNRAYLELTPYEDVVPALYRVDLYIYPTLSATVNYVHEAYLVIANPEDGIEAPWALVDALGDPAPLNYLVNETAYFDGRIQTTNVAWSRYSDDNNEYYAIPSLGSRAPDDFNNSVYEFPADPSTAEPMKAAAGAGQYSAKSVSTIADQGTTVTEYYTDSDPELDGNYEIFSVSYVERNDEVSLNGKETLTILEETVRRYYQDVSGNKTVRARTVAEMDYAGRPSSKTIVTEAVDITDDGANPITFDSVITAHEEQSGDELYVITIDLDETGAGTNVFTGTMVNEMAGRQPVTYEIALDASTGLTVDAVGDKKTKGNFNEFSRKDFKEFIFDLSSGGTFTGKVKGGAIQGIYKQLTTEMDVYLSLAVLLGVNDNKTAFK